MQHIRREYRSHNTSMCDARWETSTKCVAWGEAPTQDDGRGGGVDDEHRGSSEKGVAPVGIAYVDSSQRQPRLAVEFEKCSRFKFDRPVVRVAAAVTVERRRGSTAKVKAAMAWHDPRIAAGHCASSANGLGSLVS